MEPVPSRVNSVREYLRRRIERSSKRIARARKAAAAKPPRRGTRPDQAEIGADMATRRAYQDALRALDAIPSPVSASDVARLAAEELDRVKSALARIYEVARHANHDIADAADWTFVEGEAQAGLNVVHEARVNKLP
jgi:hypothetical protein